MNSLVLLHYSKDLILTVSGKCLISHFSSAGFRFYVCFTFYIHEAEKYSETMCFKAERELRQSYRFNMSTIHTLLIGYAGSHPLIVY